MKLRVITVTTVLFVGLVWSCSYHNVDEDVKPSLPNPCDSLVPTFGDTIWPIMQRYCSDPIEGPGCHRAGNGSVPEIIDYTTVKDLVDAGRITARVIDQDPLPMPPSGSGALDACQIDLIERWIAGGALNN